MVIPTTTEPCPYLDRESPRDENGCLHLKKETSQEIAEEYRRFLEIREKYL